MYPFILTILAGLSTMLGLIPIFIKKKDTILVSSLAYSSGIMLSISIFDLIPESLNNISLLYTIIFTILGLILSYIIDYYIDKLSKKSNLYKIGILSMLVIILHNIPEGIITYLVSSKSIILGLSITLAIAMHNIPEGISISVPIYYSTKKISITLLYTLLASLAEPFGALITYIILYKYINNFILGILFSITAGIMIEICINKLIPTSYKLDKKYFYIFFILGIITMLLTLLFFH